MIAPGGGPAMGRKPHTAGKQETLFPRLHQGLEGRRTIGQGGNLPDIQLAVEAKANEPVILPSDHRRTTERSAVQDHGRSGRKTNRAIELRTTGGQIDDLDGMALSVRLEEGRQGHRNPRIDVAVRIGITILRGWNRAVPSGWRTTRVLPECKRRGPQWVECRDRARYGSRTREDHATDLYQARREV